MPKGEELGKADKGSSRNAPTRIDDHKNGHFHMHNEKLAIRHLSTEAKKSSNKNLKILLLKSLEIIISEKDDFSPSALTNLTNPTRIKT
jgi:hypothetical protein